MISTQISTAQTLSSNFKWDLSKTAGKVPAYTSGMFVSGYAPFVAITAVNLSTPSPDALSVTYTWNFGDYYNTTTNLQSLPLSASASHRYVMPGLYTITLTEVMTLETSGAAVNPQTGTCEGLYDINWFWNNLSATSAQATIWNDTALIGAKRRTWNDDLFCIGKYCVDWSWKNLRAFAGNSSFNSAITWRETATDAVYEKLWKFEQNTSICANSTIPAPTITTISQSNIYSNVIEVVELPPVAVLSTSQSPLTAQGSISVQLSPKYTQTGSFPIDRIDWNIGDGSSIKTVWRYVTPDSSFFVYNNALSADSTDPRNYDLIYTYNRTASQAVFYPSITAYCASTGTKDSCALTIGPLTLQSPLTATPIIRKSRVVDDMPVHCIDLNQSLYIVTTNTVSAIQTGIANIAPTAPFRSSRPYSVLSAGVSADVLG